MDFNYLRRRSLFSDPNDQSGQIGSYNQFQMPDYTSPSPDEPQDEQSRFTKLYKTITDMQAGPAQQAYKKYLESMPDKEDPQYQPNKMRKLSAILGGLGEAFRTGSPDRTINTYENIVDEPYNSAVGNFKLKEGRYKTAADLEEKDMSQRIKTVRDLMEDEARKAREAEATRVNNARIKNFDSQMREREKPKYNYFNSTVTGNRQAYNPDTGTVFDIGKIGPTQEEAVKQEGAKAGARSKATLPDRLTIADRTAANRQETQRLKFSEIKNLITFKNENDMVAKEDNNGEIILVNKHDANDVRSTGWKSSKLTDQQKMDMGLKNAQTLEADREKNREKLKQTPGPDTSTTTKTEVKGNTRTTETTKSSSKPGVEKVIMLDENGKEWKVDPSEVDEAIKHNWKRKK